MTRQVFAALAAVFAMWGASLRADSGEDAVEKLLHREILTPARALFQAQAYCDARVPRLPEVETAAQWEAEAERLRREVLDQIVFRGKAAAWRNGPTRVEWLDTIPGGPGYRIRKLRYEALPGMWIPALLYEPERLTGKVPVILNVNGHSREGKAYVPKQMRCINQAKRGILALNVEWWGMGQLRTPGFEHGRMNGLDLCGASGLAPFYLGMRRGLEILLGLEHADPERVGVTGLSGGGWQTIFFSALEPRVTLAVPVAGYSSFLTRSQHLKDLGDSEQTPNDLATLVDYTHLTAMRAPRPTLLIFNAEDNCCFESGYALGPLLAAAHPLFSLAGAAGALQSHVNYEPGTHNYEQDNREALYRALREFFFDGDSDFPAREIPSEGEVKTAEELNVPLPEPNIDVQTLALRLAADLPEDAELPRDKQAAAQWRRAARRRLAGVVRAETYDVEAQRRGSDEIPGAAAEFWLLEMGRDWSVPAAVIEPPEPKGTALLIADTGRAGAAGVAVRLLAAGRRIVAIDPFGFGESYPVRGTSQDRKGTLFSLQAAAVGGRPMGIQAAQTAAAARWAARRFSEPSVSLVCSGPRTCTIGLVAAALETEAIGPVELHDSLGSLKQVIEEGWSARERPEMFCYGLLEAFDIRQLAAAAAPRPLRIAAPSPRVRSELEGLSQWLPLVGGQLQWGD